MIKKDFVNMITKDDIGEKILMVNDKCFEVENGNIKYNKIVECLEISFINDGNKR